MTLKRGAPGWVVQVQVRVNIQPRMQWCSFISSFFLFFAPVHRVENVFPILDLWCCFACSRIKRREDEEGGKREKEGMIHTHCVRAMFYFLPHHQNFPERKLARTFSVYLPFLSFSSFAQALPAISLSLSFCPSFYCLARWINQPIQLLLDTSTSPTLHTPKHTCKSE